MKQGYCRHTDSNLEYTPVFNGSFEHFLGMHAWTFSTKRPEREEGGTCRCKGGKLFKVSWQFPKLVRCSCQYYLVYENGSIPVEASWFYTSARHIFVSL